MAVRRRIDLSHQGRYWSSDAVHLAAHLDRSSAGQHPRFRPDHHSRCRISRRRLPRWRLPRTLPARWISSGPAAAEVQRGVSSATTLNGMLRKIEDKDVIVESDDKDDHHHFDGVRLNTSALPAVRKDRRFSAWRSRKHQRQKDNKGVYHASTMTLVKEGTAEEHSAASLATDDSNPRPWGSTPRTILPPALRTAPPAAALPAATATVPSCAGRLRVPTIAPPAAVRRAVHRTITTPTGRGCAARLRVAPDSIEQFIKR